MFCRSDKQRYTLADWVKTMSLQRGVRAADRSLLFSQSEPAGIAKVGRHTVRTGYMPK